MVGKTVGVKKKAKVLVGILVAVLGFTAWTLWFYVLHAPERDVQKFFTFWQWRLHSYGLKIAYESDVYGGETPEETMKLFTEAVAAHDPELASKYFIPPMQKEIRKGLMVGVENNTTGKYVELLRQVTMGSFSTSTGRYSVYSLDTSGRVLLRFELIRNPATGKWKIEEE